MDSRRRLGLALVLLLGSSVVHADPPSTSDQDDRDREWLALRIAAEGATYLALEFGFNDQLSPKQCRWCTPDAFDGAMADALAWRNTNLANTISDVTGYVLSPVVMSGMLVAAGWGNGWRRAYDDVTPIVEAAIVASLAQHLFKLSVARERPYAFHAMNQLQVTDDTNVSFWSGHASLTFSLAVAAGSVASLRGYSLAPEIWATGLGLAFVTGYLRIAADKHWTTDVMTGAAVGTILGYVWPRYVDRWIGRAISISPNGLALTKQF